MSDTFYPRLLTCLQKASNYYFETASTHYFEAWTHCYNVTCPEYATTGSTRQHSPRSFATFASDTYKWCSQQNASITVETLVNGGCTPAIAKEILCALRSQDADTQCIAFSKWIATFPLESLQVLFDSVYYMKYEDKQHQQQGNDTCYDSSGTHVRMLDPMTNHTKKHSFPTLTHFFKRYVYK
jgi:hypothetical protein